MREFPNRQEWFDAKQEIYDANPKHMKELESIDLAVECDFLWDPFRERLELFVLIDDKTTQKDVVESWMHLKVMREMLHNSQGPFIGYGPFKWRGLAYQLQTEGKAPRQIADHLNKAVENSAADAKANNDEEWQPPEDYPFDNVSVENMLRDYRKRLKRYREDTGEKMT